MRGDGREASSRSRGRIAMHERRHSFANIRLFMHNYEYYENPLITRYASRRMARLWAPQARFTTWRRLWVALAEAEGALGVGISQEQIAALRDQVETIDFRAAEEYERRFRHDVMAHIH